MPHIDLVETRRDLVRFVDYPYRKYRDDPVWVPPLRMGEFERFDPRRNPFFEHARMELYLAREGGRPVGRVALIDDDLHNEIHGDDLVFFGFFEAATEEVARALFETVEARARELGRRAVRGPANPSLNDGAGFQIDAFERRPYVMMPQNPPEYPRWTEAAGYGKVKDLYAWEIELASGETPERLERLAARVRRRLPELRMRGADMSRFDRELEHLKRLYNGEWERNWGFVPYTDAEFARLASELKLVLEPDIALFAELGGEVVGAAIALPDMNQVLARFNGRLLPTGLIHLLRRRAIVDRGRLPILGVVDAHRNKGIEIAMIDEIAKRGAAKGYRRGECSWVLEDNHAINKSIAATGATLYKTYRLYEKAL